MLQKGDTIKEVEILEVTCTPGKEPSDKKIKLKGPVTLFNMPGPLKGAGIVPAPPADEWIKYPNAAGCTGQADTLCEEKILKRFDAAKYPARIGVIATLEQAKLMAKKYNVPFWVFTPEQANALGFEPFTFQPKDLDSPVFAVDNAFLPRAVFKISESNKVEDMRVPEEGCPSPEAAKKLVIQAQEMLVPPAPAAEIKAEVKVVPVP